MAKRREEFDHTSQGSAWAAEAVTDGEKWVPAKEHPSNVEKAKGKAGTVRKLFGL